MRRGEAELPPVGNTVDIKNAIVHEHDRRRGVEDSLDATRISIRANSRSITRGCCRSRPRAGRRTTRRSSASRRRTTSPRPCRIARGLRRSGTRRAMKRARPRSPEPRSPTCSKARRVALDDAQLKQLIVGKTFKVRNTVTGQRLDILYGVGRPPPHPQRRRQAAAAGEMGDVLHSGDLGSPAHYEIRGGKIVTTISGYAFRDHRVQGRRQVRRGTQQRVRLRQLRGRVAFVTFSPKRWLREPLLHFLVAGVLLFAGYRMLHPEAFAHVAGSTAST